MNWKDYPHLFANGKFGIKYEDKAYSLIGIEWGSIRIWDATLDTEINVFTEYCTLIARPIEDMTDEEIYKTWGDKNISRKTALNIFKNRARKGMLRTHEILAMIDFGIYPFDQDDEDVEFVTKKETS